MATLQPCILTTVVMAVFILGNAANGFIVLVNCIDWTKRHKMTLLDQILTAIGLSRMTLLWMLVIHWYVVGINSGRCRLCALLFTIQIFWLVSNHFSTWLATCLGIFYLFKISNFSSLVFLHLKWRAKCTLLILMLGSFPLLISQIVVLTLSETVSTSKHEGNLTWKTKPRDAAGVANVVTFTVTNFMPFIVSMVSFLLLIFSLGKHLQKMQFSGKGARDTSTQVHVRALQTMICYLLLLAINIFDTIISIWNYNQLLSDLVVSFSRLLSFLYPSVHSWVLIWGNRKLKESFLAFLWQLRCWVRERE